MTNDKERKQTSLYLVRRAEALIGALRFFAGDGSHGNVRLVQFVTQSDYWEWEVDNLIYSFTNLAERQATWHSSHARGEKLAKLDVRISARMARQVRWQTEGGGWAVKTASVRVAPAEMLREAIDLWNAVVSRAESQVIAPVAKENRRWNIGAREDLRHLVREMPGEQELSGIEG